MNEFLEIDEKHNQRIIITNKSIYVEDNLWSRKVKMATPIISLSPQLSMHILLPFPSFLISLPFKEHRTVAKTQSMPSIISSVIIASASATAKVFVIGGLGYWAACRPKASPILPDVAMTGISKMNFNLLLLPLIYSTIASSVTPQKLGSLWFILVSALVVISSSYVVATVLGKLPFFKVTNKTDFDALRIAAAFPNILALPILIFPTLCEFAVVHDAFYNERSTSYDGEEPTELEKYKSCVDQSNAMIFVYFFGWNLLFWVIGYNSLVQAGSKRQMSRVESHATLPMPDVHFDDSFAVREHVDETTFDGGNKTNQGLVIRDAETNETRAACRDGTPVPDAEQ